MNRLGTEPSLYLRQHAANPVHWQSWGDAAWEEARRRNVPVLVSIGYSSCHWCHVMEREVFEKDELAAAMNEELVCIKVDREERPDVDMIYMEAVQRMGLGGGWPLNVFCTPEGEPFYGGTYFPPPNWAQVVGAISKGWAEHEDELRNTAEQFRAILQEHAEAPSAERQDIEAMLRAGLSHLISDADWQQGGIGGAPKFPLPGLYRFLAKATVLDTQAGAIAQLTMERMAEGGIYDHIGGGFFRYSTDAAWFAPHFEKMLYDNGQLLSLYAQGYRQDKSALYLTRMQETCDWLAREMTGADGQFYSSIDADSEGEEGRFYTWQAAELRRVLSDAYEPLADAFAIEQGGNWEYGRNILAKVNLTYELPDEIRERLFEARETRVRPSLDQKVVACWNALANLGLTDTYRYAGLATLDAALANAAYMERHLLKDGILLHQPDQSLEGYLDDYAAWLLALSNLYQATFNYHWLEIADALAAHALVAFADGDSPLLFYTSATAEKLLARKKEVNDSVIPSSNAMMASALAELGILLDKEAYRARAIAMMQNRVSQLSGGLRYSSVWGELALDTVYVPKEVSLIGPEALDWARRLDEAYLRRLILAGGESEQLLGMGAHKKAPADTTGAWVCTQGACLPPVFDFDALLKQLRG